MITYITSGFKWFFKLEAASGLLLLIAALIALIISNSSYSLIYLNSKFLFKQIFLKKSSSKFLAQW